LVRTRGRCAELASEDRRALFEEAAGITLHQSKRADALSRLDETRANLLRVNDIINEIGPRLHRLERRRNGPITMPYLPAIEGLLRTWYGFRWRQEQGNLRRAREALSRRAARVEHHRQDLTDLDGQMAALRGRQSQLRQQMAAWHGESGQLHRQNGTGATGSGGVRERARLLAGQHDEILTELNGLEVLAQAAAERITATEGETSQAQQALDELEAAVTQAQENLDLHEEEKSRWLGRWHRLKLA